MRGIFLAIGSGVALATLENALTESLRDFPLDGDNRLAFFFIGFGVALKYAERAYLLW